MLRPAMSCLICLGVVGCVDTKRSFDEFTERQADKNKRGEMEVDEKRVPDGGCFMPTAEQLVGTYLFAMSASPSPDRPILALLTITPRMTDGKLAGDLTVELLSVEDGMSTVGAKNDGTFALSGTELATPAFHVVLPGEANAVQPGLNAEAELEIVSQVCVDRSMAVKFFCGDVKGNITVPLTLPLDGSTFGAARIEDGKPWPTAIASCAGATAP